MIGVKHNIVEIVSLSIIQVWFSFWFPVYTRLGAPLNLIASSLVSIVGIACIIYLFSCPQEMIFSLFHLRSLEDIPRKERYRSISIMWSFVVFHVVMLFIWYVDACAMNGIYYLIFYFYWILLLFLLYRASNK